MNKTSLYQNVRSVLAKSPTQSEDPMVQSILTSLAKHDGMCVTELSLTTLENGNQKLVFGLLCDDMGKELLNVIYQDILGSLGRSINQAGKEFVLHPHQVRLLHRPSVLKRGSGKVVYDAVMLEFADMDTPAFNMMFAIMMTACNEAIRRWHTLDEINTLIRGHRTK